MFMGKLSAPGIWIRGPQSEPPNSSTSTFSPASDRRDAITDPAEPEPMIT